MRFLGPIMHNSTIVVRERDQNINYDQNEMIGKRSHLIYTNYIQHATKLISFSPLCQIN